MLTKAPCCCLIMSQIGKSCTTYKVVQNKAIKVPFYITYLYLDIKKLASSLYYSRKNPSVLEGGSVKLERMVDFF